MRLSAGILLVLLAGCDSPSEPDDRWAVPEEIEFAASLGIDLEAMNLTTSGLYWEDIQPGMEDGLTVVLEDEVRLHYTIWLPDGTTVETTRPGQPIQRDVLVLIPGVAEGVTGMRQEGIRRLVIRPELIGPNGHGSIPPRTTIVFEVELVAIMPR